MPPSASPPSVLRTLVRWAGLLVFVATAVLASLWFLGGAGLGGADIPPHAAAADADAAGLKARGEYLARLGNCAHCHTARGGPALAGGRPIATPFGVVRSSNITPDPVYGIGQWSADDFWRALHHGLSRDGRPLYPAFPYPSLSHLTRADADALFAYLQSIPPEPVANQPHALRWPYSTELGLRVWRALYFKPAPIQAQPRTPAEQGAYLVQGLGHCLECHAPRNALGGPRAAALGGSVLAGSGWYAPSLYQRQEASVADWPQDSVVAFLQTGHSPHGQASGPMAEVVLHGTQYLQDADAQAMASYLRTLTDADAGVPPGARPSPPALPVASRQSRAQGAQLYEQHCADCHGLQGEGRAGVYPALAGNRTVLAERPNNLVLSVLQGGFGAATAGHPRPYGMPPFKLLLDNDALVHLLGYVRSAWGNQAAPVSAMEIDPLRRAAQP